MREAYFSLTGNINTLETAFTGPDKILFNVALAPLLKAKSDSVMM